MDLGIGEKQYRVLKCEGNVAEVLSMESVGYIRFGDNGPYTESTLDKYLNTTWYNMLSTKAKNAIVEREIKLYEYAYNKSIYDETTHASYADYSTKKLKANIGNRYVYVLDVEDIEMYFGGTGGSVDDKTPATFSETDLLQKFWGQNTPEGAPWLRSYFTGISLNTWCIYGTLGYIYFTGVTNTNPTYPAFCINLTKIPFTKSV